VLRGDELWVLLKWVSGVELTVPDCVVVDVDIVVEQEVGNEVWWFECVMMVNLWVVRVKVVRSRRMATPQRATKRKASKQSERHQNKAKGIKTKGKAGKNAIKGSDIVPMNSGKK
jgi:hypothetical protein